MTRPRTIPCDNCGARLDHIPEACPECGEKIASRMESEIKTKIESRLKNKSLFKIIFPYLVIVALVGLNLYEAVILMKYGKFNSWGLTPGGMQNANLIMVLALVFVATVLFYLITSENLPRFLLRSLVATFCIAGNIYIYSTIGWVIFTSAHFQGHENLLMVASLDAGIILVLLSSKIKVKW